MDASPVSYPLSDDRLPRVDLSPDTVAQWKSKAESFVHGIVHDRQSWYFSYQNYQHLYKPIYDKDNTSGYARVVKNTKMVEFLSRGELSITLDELVIALSCKTSAEQRAVYAQLYQDAFIDGALLKLFEGQSPNDRFHCVAVKWVALRPLSKIFKGSDFIYFEYCFTTTDLSDRTVLIEFKTSMPLRPHQIQDHDLDLSRGSLFVVNTYYLENKRVMIHTMGTHDIASKFPVSFALGVMPTFFERVQNHLGLVYARFLANAGVTTNSLADRRTDVSSDCRVCSKKFKLMCGKKWCRRCGHAMCRACVKDVVMLKSGVFSASSLPITRERFCLICLFMVREQRTPVTHDSITGTVDLREMSAIQLSRIAAGVNAIDRLDERSSQYSMDSDSSVYFEDEDQTRLFTRSSSLYCEDDSIGMNSVDLVELTRETADQAALLRSMYQQGCLNWLR